MLLVVTGLALATMAGCLGLGQEQEPGEQLTPQRVTPGTTEATQTLWEKGYKDPYLDAQANGEVHEHELWVTEGTINPYGDLEIGALTFSESPDGPGQVPAPEIRVQQGDTVRVTLHAPAHTMHWHGLDVPWDSDGVPFVTQEMGDAQGDGTYVYEFVARQPGTYWYHCVVDFPAHVDFGMFGPLVIEPRDDPELPYDRDNVLLFHELDSQYFMSLDNHPDEEDPTATAEDPPDPHRLSSNPVDAADSVERQARNELDIAGLIAGDLTGQETWAEGPRDYYPFASLRYQPSYDTFMINGKSYPETQPVEIREGETVRLRLVNAGQLHKSIHLHGHHMLVTHNDGYPLPEPHWEDTISLAPGERVDAYVQGTNPGIWKLHDHSGQAGMGSTNANDYAFPGGMITAMVYEGFQPSGGLLAGDPQQNTAGAYAVHAHGGGR